MTMEHDFVLKLKIRRKPYARPVYYKVDAADRFTLDRTVKVNVNSKYLIEITITPPRRLQSVFIADQRLELIKELKKDAPSPHIDPNCRLYFAEWKTANLLRSETGTRTNIDFRFKVEGHEMKTRLQCKIYGEQEMAHSCWGNAIDFFEYRCRQATKITSFIDVIQETFVELVQR